VNNKDDIVPTLVTIIGELPVPNKALLREMMELLAYIENNSDVNKMTSSNLSIVFAPNLIRAPKVVGGVSGGDGMCRSRYSRR
jgi:hypothetical protein